MRISGKIFKIVVMGIVFFALFGLFRRSIALTGDQSAADPVLSDDQPLFEYSGTLSDGGTGNYAWQAYDAGDLGSFGLRSWYAGYEFVPQNDGSITELCGFFKDDTFKVDLYDESFKLLTSTEVESRGAWNCASVSPVKVTEGKIYYAVAEIDNSQVNYKFQCCNPPLLPHTVNDVLIKAGVKQELGQPFGDKVSRYAYLSFGLVDVKLNEGKSLIVLHAASTRPAISDPQPTGTISNNKPLMSVHTNRNATCRYDKALKNYADMLYAFTKTGGTTHTKRLGPYADGTYTRYVRCKDANGNKSHAVKITFTIKNGTSDNINPPVISNPLPTGTVTNASPTISVVTDEDANCKYDTMGRSYNTMANSFATTGSKAHSSTVGPLANGSYSYYVRCKDKAGNVNISSTKITFTVKTSGGDTTPPSVDNVTVDPSTFAAGDSFTITAKVSDNTGVKSVTAKIKDPSGSVILTTTLNTDGTGSWSKSLSSDTTDAAGKYTVDIVATDTANNSATKTKAATFTITSGGGDDTGNGSCKTLVNNGAAADKLDITFVPCGYGTDYATAEADAKKQAGRFKDRLDAADYQKINFHFVEQANVTCGSGTCTNLDSYGSKFEQIASACPTEVTVGLMKSASDGGCSYMSSGLSFVNTQYPTPVVTLHEVGHSAFGLEDEYVYSSCPGSPTGGPNCSTSGCSKWSGVAGTGCYAGCTCSQYYRPSKDCIMVSSDTTFCPVCMKQIKSVLSKYK